MAETTTFTIRVPVDLREKLERLAEATARSRSWLAAHAINEYVQSQEWQLQSVEAGLRDVEAGAATDQSAVTEWLDTWGAGSETAPPT